LINASFEARAPLAFPSFICLNCWSKDMDYITAVFPRFLQPIADLCDTMLSRRSGEPNEVQVAFTENGYSISIISLTAFHLKVHVVELAISRI